MANKPRVYIDSCHQAVATRVEAAIERMAP